VSRHGVEEIRLNPAAVGVVWCLAFVALEAVQYVFFGGVFQRISSFLFGFLAFGTTTLAIVVWLAVKAPEQLGHALRNPRTLIGANVMAMASWCAYLTAVQLIEPAVAYTISAGVMPLTAFVAYRMGTPEGEPMRNRTEASGNLILAGAIVYLSVLTVFGWSGFVRGGLQVAIVGTVLAIVEGVLFTWMLIYCQRMDRSGVGPAAVFALRFPLYIVVAGGFAAAGFDHKSEISSSEVAVIVAIGIALTVPPLYALQRAVALISTLTIGALTALGPFIIFGLQLIEGRVDYAPATLAGLGLYCIGAMLAALGAVNAARPTTP
jgi:drug/metabolite transporter (DMT)-like permease